MWPKHWRKINHRSENPILTSFLYLFNFCSFYDQLFGVYIDMSFGYLAMSYSHYFLLRKKKNMPVSEPVIASSFECLYKCIFIVHCSGLVFHPRLNWISSAFTLFYRYKGHVVGNGVPAQRHNPEVRVTDPDTTLAAVKERLEHFNHVGFLPLQQRFIFRLIQL